MKVLLVIFARFDSRRLPGKALLPIAGRPLLGRVLDRARRVSQVDDIVIATSDRAVDDPIAAFAQAENAAVFRGAADDVVGRALACTKARHASAMVRICGDSPFVDPALVDQLVERHRHDQPDITTNVFPRSFPVGMSIEVIATGALQRIVVETDEADDREHVTRYVYRQPHRFSIINVTATGGRYDGVSLAVDTDHDRLRADWIASHLPDAGSATLDQVVATAQGHVGP